MTKSMIVFVFAVMKEPECESTPTAAADDGDNNDDEHELSRRDEGGLEQAQAPLSHVVPSEFSMDPQRSPGEGESSLEENTDRPAVGGLEHCGRNNANYSIQ